MKKQKEGQISTKSFEILWLISEFLKKKTRNFSKQESRKFARKFSEISIVKANSLHVFTCNFLTLPHQKIFSLNVQFFAFSHGNFKDFLANLWLLY